MIKINQIKLEVEHKEEAVFAQVKKILQIQDQDIKEWYIDKQSIDARKKPQIYYIYSVCVKVADETAILNKMKRMKNNNVQLHEPKTYDFIGNGTKHLEHAPIVIGSGPAGLFCTLQLAEAGYRPHLLERGASVDERVEDVEHFWKTGVLNTASNVQFGEGGAGTFSDGKLNTGVKDPFGRNRKVLETFVTYGAPAAILYESKPHIGTDILMNVVRNMRNRILELGGQVSFHSQVTKLIMENEQIQGVVVNDSEIIKSQVVVLSIGHSARDTFQYLHANHVHMEAKSFAIGLRVEHPQAVINESQYGKGYAKTLPASPYKLAANLPSGRGVYSFCMCPGGYVVNASSEEGMLAVNGMSYSKRDSANANSAIVVTVNPEDYQVTGKESTVLDGMYFQQELERRTYEVGQGKIPVQLYGDFCKNIPTKELSTVKPQMKGEFLVTNVRQILPEYVAQSIQDGMQLFGRKIQGFAQESSVLSAIESRTSSPVRITRNTDFVSNINGLYPCGEGAGYAGGITSAAIDGIKVYEAIANTYKVTK